MKILLPFAYVALLLTGCAKENISPTQPTPTSIQKKDINIAQQSAGQAQGAADARGFAASYSIGGDLGGGTSSGGPGSTTTGLPPSDPNYTTTGGGPYGGSPSGTFVNPDFGGEYGAGGGVDYGPGFVPQHSYNIPGDREAAFQADLDGLKAAGQAHLQDAFNANDQDAAAFWIGYIEGVDNYLSF